MDATPDRAPANPYGPSPLRRPGSLRRTSTIDSSWPEGIGKTTAMRGRARDLLTPADDSAAQVLSDDWMALTVTLGRQIGALETNRLNNELQALVGCRGGGHLRKEITRVIGDEQAQGTPLHLLLDDFSGASLVSGWAWSRWNSNWMNPPPIQAVASAPGAPPAASLPGRNGRMEGICSGFRPGSSALRADGTSNPGIQSSAAVPPLTNPDDPVGWHELPQQEGVGMRRARRLDVWMQDEVIGIDVAFQDSATSPAGGDRIAVHEYRVTATADPATFELLSIEADPRVLPYRECPAAAPNASRMVGQNLSDFRLAVLDTLPGTLGCTHLNDVLRSMADVPQLVDRLRKAL